MCTLEKRDSLFILTLSANDDHRLSPNLIDAIKSALDRLRSDSSHTSSALITTAHGKFFSNGYVLSWAQKSIDQFRLMSLKFESLLTDLISLPMPTIAAVTGHASGAGRVLALCHDYV